jgi:phosphotransferase system enzyme I (PtsI)
MTFAIHGLAVARGVAIGRAVMVASSRVDVAHYFVDESRVPDEIQRVRDARDAVVEEIQRMQDVVARMSAHDTPQELSAILDVHLMLLTDQMLEDGVKHWISVRLYNAEWALTTQLEVIARQFDEMEDPYLRERKADLEQVVERLLRHMKGVASPVAPPLAPAAAAVRQQDLPLGDTAEVPQVLIALRPTCCSSSRVSLPAS